MRNALSWSENVPIILIIKREWQQFQVPSSMKTKAAASIVYIKETDSRQAMLWMEQKTLYSYR